MRTWPRRFATDMFPPVTSKWRLVAVLLALSIGAAACGSTATSTAPTLAPQATNAVADDGSPDESAPDDAATTDSAPQDEAASPAVNLFPDIDVLNIADGATVNLAAELGGADKATLLWFFAPH